MKRIIGEDVDGIEGGIDPAIEEQLGAEKDAVEGDEIGLERVIVVIVESGGLGKEI